ncbi:hypothetical protein J6590_092705 [Homalodisca vitripennis]|nr:hypothetical protein J6590_092705 [Homalodisca vitripennis]
MCGDEDILEDTVTCNSVLKLATEASKIANIKGVAKINVVTRAQANSEDTSSQKPFRKGAKISPKIWHRRLGHIHMDAVNKLFDEQLATGINLSFKGKATVCDVCCRGKQAARPFTERVDRSRVPLEIV